MPLLYEFDTFGIVYTAVFGALSLLMLIALVRLAAAGKPSTSGTVFFRVIDIVLIVVMIAVWCVYVLTKTSLFGLSVTDADGSLAFMNNDTELFAVPMLGGAVGVFGTVLGTGLAALLSLLAVVDLVLAFARRRSGVYVAVITGENIGTERVPYAPEAEQAPAAPEVAQPAPTETPVAVTPDARPVEAQPAPAAETAPEPAETGQPVTAETVPEEPAVAAQPAEEPVKEEVPAAGTEPAEQRPAPVTETVPSAPAAEETHEEEQAAPAAEKSAASEPAAEPTKQKIGEEKAQPAAAAAAHTAAQTPQPRVFSDYVEVSRLGGNVSDKTYSSAVQLPEKKKMQSENVAAEKEAPPAAEGGEKLAFKMPPLPVTRKLVITNRMNVVNMFNNYLNDKEKDERDKLSGSIGKIIIK
ncbi:MAG TPA: hypothetical protein H9693_07325 [Firmicutes bacterium]|nr:hypothetical protein [Bacillota bacterium]